MKRHGFSGQPASHGQSLMHRGMGSAGGSQGSGSRVLPGKRMAGRMGNESVTVKNLRVLQVDEENGIVVVNGTYIISFCRLMSREKMEKGSEPT
jgi:large subunit ribosomal protein L3